MARPTQSVLTKTTSVLVAYRRHHEKYSPGKTCREASQRYMRYTKICNLHLRMNFGSWHSQNRTMLSAATLGQNLCSHGNREKTVEMQTDTGASCKVLSSSYLPLADAEIQKTKQKLLTYSKSILSVLGTTIVSVQNPRNNVEFCEECIVV